MPAVEQMVAQVAGARVFSKLDANIILADSIIKRFSYIDNTPNTIWPMLLPFGITSAPEHFQKRMSTILADHDGVVCLVDDVLVHGKNQIEHHQRVKAVLQRLL